MHMDDELHPSGLLDPNELLASLGSHSTHPLALVVHGAGGDAVLALRLMKEDALALLDKVQPEVLAKEMQKLLHRRAELVESALVPEYPEIQPAGGEVVGRLHFLLHGGRSQLGPPDIVAPGPASGYMYPGDEAAYPGLAILKTDASGGDKLGVKVAIYREVKLGPAHEAGDIRTLAQPKKAPSKSADFEECSPKISMIVITPNNKRPRIGAGQGSSAAAVQDAVFKNVEVTGDLRVHGSIQQSRGDRAYFRRRRDEEQHLAPGMIVACVDELIGKSAGSSSVAQWFVISTKPVRPHLPCFPPRGVSKNMHMHMHMCMFLFLEQAITNWHPLGVSDDEVAQLWHPCALEGQVPVLVSGHATRGSLLVPSGQEDGYARAIQLQQLSDEPHLCRCILGRVLESSSERADGYTTLLSTHRSMLTHKTYYTRSLTNA